jgi:hypothetical protein
MPGQGGEDKVIRGAAGQIKALFPGAEAEHPLHAFYFFIHLKGRRQNSPRRRVSPICGHPIRCLPGGKLGLSGGSPSGSGQGFRLPGRGQNLPHIVVYIGFYGEFAHARRKHRVMGPGRIFKEGFKIPGLRFLPGGQ